MSNAIALVDPDLADTEVKKSKKPKKAAVASDDSTQEGVASKKRHSRDLKQRREGGQMLPEDYRAADNLRRIFNEKAQAMGLTQAKLAKQMQGHQPKMSAYLNGKRPIGTDTALYLAKALGVSPTDIREELKEFFPRVNADKLANLGDRVFSALEQRGVKSMDELRRHSAELFRAIAHFYNKEGEISDETINYLIDFALNIKK